jgi:hypothetical protein
MLVSDVVVTDGPDGHVRVETALGGVRLSIDLEPRHYLAVYLTLAEARVIMRGIDAACNSIESRP